MKSFRRLSLGYFVALAAILLASATARAEMRHNSAVVRTVRGSADVSADKGRTWKKAAVGSRLSANSVIKTAPGSTADLFLGENGPIVRVTEDTQLGIDKLDIESTGIEKVIETQLDLRAGKILGSVKKMAAASKYEVKTPVGVAGIRGTEYSIDARGRVSIVTGQAVVVYVVDGVVISPVTVNAGQTVVPPVSGQVPQVTSGGAVSGIETLDRGIVTNPDGTLTVTLENGVVVSTTRDGITTVGGGGPGDGGDLVSTTPAPAPGGSSESNPNGTFADQTRAEQLSRSSPLFNRTTPPAQTGGSDTQTTTPPPPAG